MKKKSLKNNTVLVNTRDIKIFIIIFSIISIFFYESTKFPTPMADLANNIKPATFPQILIFFILLFSLAIPFENYFLKKYLNKDLDKERSKPVPKITILTMLFLTAIVISAQFLGILITMFFTCVGLPILWGEKRFLLVFIFSIIFPAVIYYVFHILLKVYLEPGILSIFFK